MPHAPTQTRPTQNVGHKLFARSACAIIVHMAKPPPPREGEGLSLERLGYESLNAWVIGLVRLD